MFLFAIKKWFFDFWDHLLLVILGNVIFDIGLAILLIPGSWLGTLHPVLGIVALVLGVLLNFLIAAAINGLSWGISRHENFRIVHLKEGFQRGLVPALVLGALNLVIFIAGRTAMEFYGAMDSIVGFLLMGFIFWALVFWVAATAWYFPINAQLDTKPSKLLRKIFILTFDNPGLTLGMAVGSLIILLLSALSLTLFPGLTGLMLWHQTILKLVLYKYDWLEAHPGATAKDIPWPELLQEENDKIGPRSLKSLIFPWKD